MSPGRPPSARTTSGGSPHYYFAFSSVCAKEMRPCLTIASYPEATCASETMTYTLALYATSLTLRCALPGHRLIKRLLADASQISARPTRCEVLLLRRLVCQWDHTCV